MNGLSFLKVAIKDYKIGAVARTSKRVSRKILSFIKSEYKYFVEYGPGDGAVTKEILSVMPADGRYVAIEQNEDFIRELQKIKDSRLTIIKGDIVELTKNLNKLGLPRIDFALSSVPFTIIKPKVREEIVRNTYDAIASGGRFIMFQYSFLMRPIIKKIFRKFRSLIEFKNFPPICMMAGTKE